MMKSKSAGKWIVGSAVVIIALIAVFMGIGYNNSAVRLENQASAQEEVNQAIYDEVWKVIKQQAGVTEEYANNFKEIYAGIMSGRYEADSSDNPAFKWIHEQNPQFSSEMYMVLMDTIKGERTKFTTVQAKLRDIKREHDDLRTVIPSKWFVGGRDELQVTIVTSRRTKDTFKTGEENDVDLFDKE